ncbi:high mobility group box domain-containing protein [Flammula alnicola]|nr:high mobility group box domain-containing protein [Flammula alnicola]
MPDQVSKFEHQRAQLAASLSAVADSMRNCAQMAETFAKIVSDSTYSPENAELLHESTKGKRKAALSPEEGDGTKKRKRNTKPKDPNAPKRPASSYILFQNEVRKELKEQHPNLSNSDLLGMISEQWKHMSEEQKETYNQAMKTAKIQYSEEKKAYDNRTPEEIEAANAAAAAALTLKKANSKPRGPKAAAAAAAAPVKARPPPTIDEVSPSSESSEDEDSEEEAHPEPKRNQPDTESSDEEEEPQPAPKKRRGASVQPKEKSKKGSKA